VTARLGATPLSDVVVIPDPDRTGCWRLIVALPPMAAPADAPFARTVADPFPGVVLHQPTRPDADGGATSDTRDDRTDAEAELRLLRAEVELLKHAFRRHCIETG
jgi:hypothetical protein